MSTFEEAKQAYREGKSAKLDMMPKWISFLGTDYAYLFQTRDTHAWKLKSRHTLAFFEVGRKSRGRTDWVIE